MKRAIKMAFIGREKELSQLRWLLENNTAALATIRGRRRVGKSRLVTEFAKDLSLIRIAGIAPTKNTTAQSERDEFAEQLAIQTNSLNTTANSWNILFHQLAEKTQHGQHIILLDEISWMGSKDDTFLGKLKNAWDMLFSNNPQLILILCGSVSTWIEKEIINSTLFLGRPALNIVLKPLSIELANQFWVSQHVSAYEKLKLLSITGGIPRYLELLNTNKPAEENISRLFFTENSPLSNEFKRIFSDIFGKRSQYYVEIIRALVAGSKTQTQLIEATKRKTSGVISDYLNDLIESGFIARDYAWSFSTRKTYKLSRYRIQDNYLRFYLKCIEPNGQLLDSDIIEQKSLNAVPGWLTTIGLQFECLIQNNISQVIKALNLKSDDIVQAGPYFQTQTKKKQGCQIDLLIQTRYNVLFVCEIKFRQKEIKKDIIQEVDDKILRLVRPKGFSCFPVLIHVNGVHEEVLMSDYFSHIVDLDFLLG
jgi:AAA+ ATPase superfamily predicted ATPase